MANIKGIPEYKDNMEELTREPAKPEIFNMRYQILLNNDAYLEENKLDKTGDAKDVTVTFTEAEKRENISAGEKLSVMLGKIKKWFADLHKVAFSGSYNDLSNKPTAGSLGLGNVGNFKAVSTVESQGLTDTEKENARKNIGASSSVWTDITDFGTLPSTPGKYYANANYKVDKDTKPPSAPLDLGNAGFVLNVDNYQSGNIVNIYYMIKQNYDKYESKTEINVTNGYTYHTQWRKTTMINSDSGINYATTAVGQNTLSKNSEYYLDVLSTTGTYGVYYIELSFDLGEGYHNYLNYLVMVSFYKSEPLNTPTPAPAGYFPIEIINNNYSNSSKGTICIRNNTSADKIVQYKISQVF